MNTCDVNHIRVVADGAFNAIIIQIDKSCACYLCRGDFLYQCYGRERYSAVVGQEEMPLKSII